MCQYCNAILWYEERNHKSKNTKNPKFSICCQEGRVFLLMLKSYLIRENITSGADVKPVFYASLLKSAMWKTLPSHLKALSKQQTPNRKERNPAKAHAFTPSFMPSPPPPPSRLPSAKAHAEPPPPPHRSPEQNDFEEERVLAMPSTSSSGLCHPLLAQTSTTTHTEAERFRRRRVRRSLETNRSHREPRSKGLLFIIFPFPQFGFQNGCSDFLFASSESFKF